MAEIIDFSFDSSDDDFEKGHVKSGTIRNWVENSITSKSVKFANEFGKSIAAEGKGMTNSQIRNIFGEMRRIQMNGFNEKERVNFILLKPKMAYLVKRFRENKKIESFYKFFSEAYDAVDVSNSNDGKKHFENFMSLMEAVLAFHKYHGGKE